MHILIVEPWVGEKPCGLKPIVCDDGDLSRLFKLTVHQWRKCWKPTVGVVFLNVWLQWKRDGVLGFTVSMFGNSCKPSKRFLRSLKCRKSRWNCRFDCFQVWKPSKNHVYEFPQNENYGETIDITIHKTKRHHSLKTAYLGFSCFISGWCYRTAIFWEYTKKEIK